MSLENTLLTGIQFSFYARNIGSVEAVELSADNFFIDADWRLLPRERRFAFGSGVIKPGSSTYSFEATGQIANAKYVVACARYFDAPEMKTRNRYSQCFFFRRENGTVPTALSGQEREFAWNAIPANLRSRYDISRLRIAYTPDDTIDVARHDNQETRNALRAETLKFAGKIEAWAIPEQDYWDQRRTLLDQNTYQGMVESHSQIIQIKWHDDFSTQAKSLLIQYEAMGGRDTKLLKDEIDFPINPRILVYIAARFRTLAASLSH